MLVRIYHVDDKMILNTRYFLCDPCKISVQIIFPILGVLPLATENEDDQQLGFFPPFNVRKPQPK